MRLNAAKAMVLLLGMSVVHIVLAEDLVNVPFKNVLQVPFNEANQTITYGDKPLQFGKLWRPKTSQHSAPLIIFIHGGCWLNAFSLDHSFALTSALADFGAIVWSLEYRRTGDEGGGWPGTFDDVLSGVNFALAQTQWDFDATKIYIVGHSAGGHLALLANDALSPTPDQNVSVIGLAAITNVITYSQGQNSCQLATPKFMGGNCEQKKPAYHAANPKRTDNVILIHGNQDNIVPLSQSKFSTAPAIMVEGAGHFDFLHPQSTAFKSLISVINKGINKETK